MKEKGITLVSLIVTIIIILILAGISLSALTGDNGLINKASNAKESSEIAEEKEIIQKSAIEAIGKNSRGNLTKDEFETKIKQNAKDAEIKVYNDDEGFIVIFNKRTYIVDSEGNVETGDSNILVADNTLGDITKADDGRTLAGTESDPYLIMSIEDLVNLSKITNTNVSALSNKYVKLGKKLDFKSELSYADCNTREYNEYLGVIDDVGLMEALTNENYKGFVPMKDFYYGKFDGDGKSIKNIYINKEENAGLFAKRSQAAGGMTNETAPIINCVNEKDVEVGNNNVGGIVGDIGYTQSDKGKVINCYNLGELTGNVSSKGEILGKKGGYGTNYIINCYGVDGTGNALYNGGTLDVTNCEAYSKQYMKTEGFLKKLNDYVEEYNLGEKTETNSIELLTWKFDSTTGFPTF